jgi:DNA-directed RNA polymerase specialized sigma24 family protein
MEEHINILTDLKGESSYAFGILYKNHFVMVSRFVIKNSGTALDAEDVFQDTMLVLVEKLRQDDFVLTASIKTYIMAISKHLWFKKLRSASRELEFTDVHNSKLLQEIEFSIEQEKTYWDKLQFYMTKITDHCSRLMHDMFFKNKPIEQIQIEHGYTSRHNAQNQKHKCMEQIRKVKNEDEKNKSKIFICLG